MSETDDKFHIDFEANGVAFGTRERADGSTEQATLTPVSGLPLQDGQEVVQTTEEGPSTLRMRTIYKHKGPARASNKAYRAGYEAIFGRQKIGQA